MRTGFGKSRNFVLFWRANPKHRPRIGETPRIATCPIRYRRLNTRLCSIVGIRISWASIAVPTGSEAASTVRSFF